MKFSWTQPCCQECWDVLHPDRTATRLVHPVNEICAWCGRPTIDGIYVRNDPHQVPYPRIEEA